MLRIKEQYFLTAIAFGSSGKALQHRSEDELRELAILALSSGDPTLLQFFEQPMPSLIELQTGKMKATEQPSTPVKTVTGNRKKKEITHGQETTSDGTQE